jgi:urease accessory protein
LLIFAPEPVQAFAESIYSQQQAWRLAKGASLVLLDWFSSGRAARGERWAFQRLASGNEVFYAGDRVLFDSINLDSADGRLNSQYRGGRFHCLAMLLLIGPALCAIAAQALKEISARPVQNRASVVSSASPIPCGTLLRFAGEEVEGVAAELGHFLDPVWPLLGEDPWRHKWCPLSP